MRDLHQTAFPAALVLIGIVTSFFAQAEQNEQFGFADGDARWIALPGQHVEPNDWIMFRRSFDLNSVPEEAVVDIAVDSKYWLWVNGEMVIFEGGLKRGPNPKDTYFDRVDLAPYLQEGENTVAILVWFFGKEGFSHKDSGMPGLIFDARLGDDRLVSDASWHVQDYTAYGAASGDAPNFRLPESNLRFDQRLAVEGWEQPGFDDSDWAEAAEIAAVGDAPWNALHLRPIPQWFDGGIQMFDNGSQLPYAASGERVVYRLPHNAQFTPYFKVRVPERLAGQVIEMRTETGAQFGGIRAEYVLAAGEHSYESLGWLSGEELWLDIPEGVRLLEVGFRETGFDTRPTDGFTCDDARLNLLMQKDIRTMYVNMRDTFFDCPERERALWWGDAVNELGQLFYSYDTNSHSLVRKSILNLADWARPNGTLFSPIPAGNWDRELPLQMLNSVGHYGFATYYRHTGDVATIEHVYPAARDYTLRVWSLNDEGLLDVERMNNPQGPTWVWTDWGDHKDRDVQANAWYYLALQGLREIALAINNDEDLAEIDRRMASIEENFNRGFWQEHVYRSPGYQGQDDDRAQALAVVSGLAPESHYPDIHRVILENEHASPYIEKYVHEALCLMGYHEDMVLRLRRRYAYWIDSPFSTLGEGWNTGQGTKNHAWNAPLTVLAEHVAGITPVEPGYRVFRVAPNLAGLDNIALSFETVRGPIAFEMSKNDTPGPIAGYRIALTSPEKTIARVSLPLDGIASIERITVNGQAVCVDGAFVAELSHAIGDPSIGTDGRVHFDLLQGQWEIEVSGPQAGSFSTVRWEGDAALSLDRDRTYSHAIDFRPGGLIGHGNQQAQVSRVMFTQADVGTGFSECDSIEGVDARSGAAWSLDGVGFGAGDLGARAEGHGSATLSDALVTGGPEGIHELKLEGLEPNTDYIFTWYSPTWDDNVSRIARLDGGDDGFGKGTALSVDQDISAEPLIVRYRYNTGNATEFTMRFTNLNNDQVHL